MNVDPVRLIQFGQQGRSAHTRRPFLAGPGYTDDLFFVRQILANQVVFRVRDQDVALTINT